MTSYIVKINGKAKPVLLNSSIVELCGYLEGTPTIQDFIDDNQNEITGELSECITGLIAKQAVERIKSLGVL